MTTLCQAVLGLGLQCGTTDVFPLSLVLGSLKSIWEREDSSKYMKTCFITILTSTRKESKLQTQGCRYQTLASRLQ